ncbi:YtjB family periplasmic protein [Ursidibacter arcticus]
MRISSGKIVKTSAILFVMVLCLAIVTVILTGINHFKVGSQLASINQVSNLSHLLVRQQAKLFSLMLVKNVKNDELVEALDTFAKEEFVIDANLYSTTGTLIAQSHNALKFEPELHNKSQEKQATQQIVEPIFSQQDLVGFLRVTFDSQYGQTTQSKVNELFHLLYGELVILFLAGGLFISCFFYFIRKKVQIISVPNRLNKIETTKQSQRFHSRRRAFKRK